MRRKPVFFLLLLLALTGCSSLSSQSPSPTEGSHQVVVPPTNTLGLASTSTVTPFPTDPYTPTPTMTPTAAPAQQTLSQPAAIIARVAGGPKSFLLLGGSQNGSWVAAAEMEGDLTGRSKYKLYIPFEFQEWGLGQELGFARLCDEHFITIDRALSSQSAVGISGDWDVFPRTPVALSTEIEPYLQSVAAWQVDQAPSQPIAAIQKVWLIDVEGNGTDEVFINASHFTESTGHNVEPRDYTVILMRTVIGSEVVTVELAGDYYTESAVNYFPLTYNLEFIADLNGDGKMEVVVGVSRWEGTGVMVFEIDGAEADLVLSALCTE